jgi:hypothetical protein
MLFHTLFIREKYPAYYPKMLAKTLEPFDCQVICYIDRDKERIPPNPNLNLIKFDTSTVPKAIQEHPMGWWHKLLFFNQAFHGQERLWFVDLDTLFQRDPRPIFQHHDARCEMCFLKAYFNNRDDLGSGLFYLNFLSGKPQQVWEKAKNLKRTRKYMDQDFLVETIPDHCFYPDHHMVSFPHWFLYRPNVRLYEEYREVAMHQVISWAFLSDGKPHEIVLNEKLGHNFIRKNWPWIPNLLTCLT